MSRTSLTELSKRNVVRPNPLQMGPGYPEVLGDRTIGGPEDPADRRLVLGVDDLQRLLDIARESPSRRVVLHHFGLRVQLLRSREDHHRWEHVTLLGSEAKPERVPLGLEL